MVPGPCRIEELNLYQSVRFDGRRPYSVAATPITTFIKLRFPNSLPYVFSALEISSSLSVVGAIVGEFVGAQGGIGYLILVSSYHLETDVMFAAVISAALGGVAFSLVSSPCLKKSSSPGATPSKQPSSTQF